MKQFRRKGQKKRRNKRKHDGRDEKIQANGQINKNMDRNKHVEKSGYSANKTNGEKDIWGNRCKDLRKRRYIHEKM